MEILNTIPITQNPQWCEELVVVLLIIFAVSAVAFLLFAIANLLDGGFHQKETIISGAVWILSFLLIFAFRIYAQHNQEITERCRYEVVFTEDFDISRLYDSYVIVEQRGKIWVIEDKED